MSWEYHNKETALKFAQLRRPIPDEPVKKIIEELRLKYKEEKQGDVGKDSPQKFELMLDAGCGTGETIEQFVPFFKSITAFDSSHFQIEQAVAKHPAENVTYLVGSGEAMPVSDRSVDLATFIFSAFYMDVKKVEVELYRVLKPNGLAVFYSHYFVGIDLVNDSCLSVYPELAVEAIGLWDDCFKIFGNYAIEKSHPVKDHLSKYEEVYQGLSIFNKKIDEVKSSRHSTLEEMIGPFHEGIPFYRNASKALGFSPAKDFAENLKKLWKIPDVANKDVNLNITISSFMIFLDRKK